MVTRSRLRMLRLTAGFGMAAVGLMAQEETPDKRLRNSASTFHEIMSAPDRAIPRNLLERARCIVIVPGMKKAAFMFGGEYGRGFASCRLPGGWSAPAPVRLTGGSFGVQLGADSTDIVLLLMNQHGLERLLSDKFSIGADLAGAAGPVGRNASADTDVSLKAEILSYSRTRGVFAGASLNGTVVEADQAETRKLYGRQWGNREIIRGGVAVPDAAKVLADELARDVYQK
jgi:lipid-binding SYLF domain-containing protein